MSQSRPDRPRRDGDRDLVLERRTFMPEQEPSSPFEYEGEFPQNKTQTETITNTTQNEHEH